MRRWRQSGDWREMLMATRPGWVSSEKYHGRKHLAASHAGDSVALTSAAASTDSDYCGIELLRNGFDRASAERFLRSSGFPVSSGGTELTLWRPEAYQMSPYARAGIWFSVMSSGAFRFRLLSVTVSLLP